VSQTECRSSISGRLLGYPDIWLLRELVWFEPRQYERLARLGRILPQQSIHYSIELRGERRSQRIRVLTSTRHYLPWGFKLSKIPQEDQFPISGTYRKLKLSYLELVSKPTQCTGALELRPRSALRRLR
jgi:hypothetical protein